MKKILLVLAGLAAPMLLLAQATLVVTGTTPVAIVEKGGTAATPIYIVIDNPAATATKVTGTQGGIVSENEYNFVKWNIGATSGTPYVVPFAYVNASPLTFYSLPVTLDIGTAGSAGGSILFSTFHTIADIPPAYPNANTPHDVTSMGSFWGGLGSPSNIDNTENVVDRFWIMDATSYTTKPALIGNGVTFSYISNGGTPSEVISPNTLSTLTNEQSLLVQRFNTTVGVGWGDFVGLGATNSATAGSNVASSYSGPVTAPNFWRSWTLASSIDPLPISLSTFGAQCENGTALIQWTSQTELNNNYYTIQRSTDGVHLETLGTVKAQGTGTSDFPENYSFTDNSPYAGTSYYFLLQTDMDGTTKMEGNTIFGGCGSSSTTVIQGYNTTNFIQVNIDAASADNFTISLVNMLGQSVLSEYHSVAQGSNEIRLNNSFSPGIYILNVRNDKVNYAKKLVLGIR